jgi:hypothetical protein
MSIEGNEEAMDIGKEEDPNGAVEETEALFSKDESNQDDIPMNKDYKTNVPDVNTALIVGTGTVKAAVEETEALFSKNEINQDDVPMNKDYKNNAPDVNTALIVGTDAVKAAVEETEALFSKEINQDDIPMNKDYKNNAADLNTALIVGTDAVKAAVEETEALFSKEINQDDIPMNKDYKNNAADLNTALIVGTDAVKAVAIGPNKGSADMRALTRNPIGNHTGTPSGNAPAYHSLNALENYGTTHAPNATTSSTWNAPAPANDPEYLIANRPTPMKSTTDKYPQDSYSFLALYGPMGTEQKRTFFLFGLLPFIFQMVFLFLLVVSETNELKGTIGENDNPDSGKSGLMGALATFIPANANAIVRCTQITSIAAYVIFPDSSLKDVVRAVQSFPRSSKVQSGDPVGCMRFSCLLRGMQGILAMFVTVLLVARSDSVVDIILNFTAVNFISNLDDHAFSLAMSGDFGPALEAESKRIANVDLPPCLSMDKASKFVCNKIVVGLISVILFAMMIFVIIAQTTNGFWVTSILRVQFQEKLNEYSGCFEIDHRRSLNFFLRRTYNSVDKGIDDTNTLFGYCRENREWVLFKSGKDTFDPCDASKNEVELAHSSKTDSFDISTSFDASWVSVNTPLDLYFFQSGEKNELHCDLFLGDGICNVEFNQLGYNYDSGDCCASTCVGSKCGRGGLRSVFGDWNISGTHFPNCNDPKLVPITIQLNSISSSRDLEFAVFENWWKEPWQSVTEETEWRSTTPVKPYFALDCNQKNVLTVYIEPSMVNKVETVMVKDGANCTLVVRNTTTASSNIATDDAIWFINYTIFDGEKNAIESEKVEIVTQQSNEKENAAFTKIPKCYSRKLDGNVDIKTIYTASDPSNEAIDWLVEDDPDGSKCEDEFFIDRFALSTIVFAMKGKDILIKKEDQCTWPSIICTGGQVTKIKMQSKYLQGAIPNELMLLTNLEELKMCKWIKCSNPDYQ